MARQQGSSDGHWSILAGGTVSPFRLVKLSSGTAVHNTATSTDVPVGVAQAPGDGDSTYSSGEQVNARGVKAAGTHKVTAAGAISKGADIYAAAAGKVQALPGGAGTYRKVGIALEASSADDDVIEAWLDPAGDTDTVSGS